MKVTSIELHASNGSLVIPFSFRDPRRQNAYNVRAIFGLDPDSIVSRSSGTSGPNGRVQHSFTLEQRELIIRAHMNPAFGSNETYSDLRDSIYRLIAACRHGYVTIKFLNGETVVATVSGNITKVESPQFNQTQEIQITVEAEDPMLRAPDAIDVDLTGLDPEETLVVDDISTAPHGVTLEVTLGAALASVSLGDDPELPQCDWIFEVTPSGGFEIGDVLHISSEIKNKKVYIDRSSTIIHLADVISPNSSWPMIFPGDNGFSFQDPTDLTWTTIQHRPAFWGI